MKLGAALPTLLLIISAGISAAPVPQITAKYSESQLEFLVPPTHFESLCGGAMFGIERRYYSANGDAWVCVSPNATSGKMDIVNWGYFGTFLDRVVRNPTATDRNFILANDNNLIALDPVTLQQISIGTFNPPVNTVNSGTVFELLPEHVNEILINTADGWEIRTFPGGNLLFSHMFGERRVGHFLSSQSTQLVDVGNDQFDLYDAHNGQFVRTVQSPQTRGIFGIYDWAGDGLDNIYFSNISVQLSSMNLSTTSTVRAGSTADFLLYSATPVKWSGSKPALAGVWYDAVRVFNPVSGALLYTETLPVNAIQQSISSFWATDYNADGKQDLLWTAGNNLHFLPNGGPSRYLQTATGGYQVAGMTGPGFDVLVTGDTYFDGEKNESYLDIVLREPETLHEILRRTDPAPVDSRVFVGQYAATTDSVLITADEGRIAAERLTDGKPLWEIDNDKFSSGNAWDSFAVPPSTCTGVACKRMLIASIAFDSNTHGSFLQVIDTRDGTTLWSSTPDIYLDYGSRQIAFADMNGDGVPDIVRMHPYQENMQMAGVLQMIDGATFQVLWSATYAPNNIDPVAIAVATIGRPNVAVWTGSTLTLLDAADGHIIASAPTVAQVDYYRSSLHFVALSPDEGVWMIASGATDVEWLPADLSRPVQTLAVPAVETIAGGVDGVVFGAGPEGVFRMVIPTDHLFTDGFEP
ncbi:VCBS repeat-containing protein [Pseudolysobacter antarcticus]|uniref:VCBS repeat-containing protein n=1 Tax=Pseudolysobacter antarcticus TaxID=2511995 RepID=A0A411HPB9_9GAMM|nr:VCBS repeat-containing protein [Pseudolysobacter antarcticus]QBB72348.1 VCBS repeat-containing protein [Pseudolysobacter antarcticus]